MTLCHKSWKYVEKLISLSNEVGELVMPQQADPYIEKGLECYQNDEGNVEAEDVGMIPEDLCDEIHNITNDCETHNFLL